MRAPVRLQHESTKRASWSRTTSRDTVDRMVRQTTDHLPHRPRVETIEFCRFDERVGRGGALAAGIGPGEKIILPARGNRTGRAFGRVVAHRQCAVIEIARKRSPTRAGIADFLGQVLRPEIITSDASKKHRKIADQGAFGILANSTSLFRRQSHGRRIRRRTNERSAAAVRRRSAR